MCPRARGRFSLEGDYIWTAARQVRTPAAEGLATRIAHGPLSWARAVLPCCRARAVLPVAWVGGRRRCCP